MPELSEQQTKAFRVIVDYYEKHGFPPTQEEIATQLNIGRSTAREHLDALEKKGYISRDNARNMIQILISYHEASIL